MRVNIDGKIIEAAEGTTILEAARENGIKIPSLCYLRELNCISVCRVCMVECGGNLMPACSTPVHDGMEIVTDSQQIRDARRKNLELICCDHHMDCTDCPRGADCELRELCKEYEVDDRAFGLGKRRAMRDESTPYLVRDNARCILCRRCEAVCSKLQGVKAIATNNKGGETNIGFGLTLAETDCVGCGQCVAVCPTGALAQKDDTKKAWKAIFDKEKYVAAAVSPSAYKRIGELFGERPGTDCGRKLAELFRKIGFDAVFDLAEAEEWSKETMLAKAAAGSISGSCPAWRRYIEKKHPELCDRLVFPENPMELLRGVCRAAAGEKETVLVRFSNCISCKGDASDYIQLSTREAFEMVRRACVSSFTADKIWADMSGEDFDTFPTLPVVASKELRIIEADGISAGEKMLSHWESCDMLIVRACPGGCINGGGMPRKSEEGGDG